MKLLIALTPAILIGCAFVETCAAIVNKKQPSVVAAAVSRPHPVHAAILQSVEPPVVAASAPARLGLGSH